MLHAVPLWLLLGLTVVGGAILYAPPIEGLDLAVARTWPWTAPSTVLSGVLLLARGGADIFNAVHRWHGRRLAPALKLTFQAQINTTWWSHSVQPDGQTLTQIMIDLHAYNFSQSSIRLVAVRLIRPHLPRHLFKPSTHLVTDPMHLASSPDRPVRAHANAKIRVGIFAGRALGSSGKLLPVTIGLTDQRGYEYRVKVPLWPILGAE